MSAATLQLGPWPQGLNLASNRDLSPFLAPTELGEATNVVLTPEGFVEPRPGCKKVVSSILYEHVAAGSRIKVLGSVKLPSGEICALVQVFATSSYVYKVFSPTDVQFYFNATDTEFTHVIQHNGITGHTGVIFCAKQDGKSYITTDMSLAADPTLITGANGNTFPGSDGGMIVKDRLFLYNGSQSKVMWSPATYILNWSKTADPSSPNGDDIAGYELIEPTVASDGIMSIEFFNNSFYIFKKTKTYVFTYQTAPVDDGYMRKISDEFGALDSTMYRGQIVVFNHKGVFRVDGTEFIDLQSQLNLRFEIPIDHNAIDPRDVFVTDFNNNILIGFRDTVSTLSAPDMLWRDEWVGNAEDSSDLWTAKVFGEATEHYYCMNGETGGWTKWDYSYNRPYESAKIASPGSRQYLAQPADSVRTYRIFNTFDRESLVYMEGKPLKTIDGSGSYHLDSSLLVAEAESKLYIPSVTIKTKASIGGSMLRYKKIYRTFMRFYLSDQSMPNQVFKDTWIGNAADGTDLWMGNDEDNTDLWTAFPEGLWTASINYNDYRFNRDAENDGNYIFYVYPNELNKDIGNSTPNRPEVYSIPPTGGTQNSQNTNIYRRAYQLPIPQQRAVEFVFELKRRWSTISNILTNPDADRLIKNGYYFMLSGVWFDYNDKAGI